MQVFGVLGKSKSLHCHEHLEWKLFKPRSVAIMVSNGNEKNSMKLSKFIYIKQENVRPGNENQVPIRQIAMDDTRMDGPYDAYAPHVDP